MTTNQEFTRALAPSVGAAWILRLEGNIHYTSAHDAAGRAPPGHLLRNVSIRLPQLRPVAARAVLLAVLLASPLVSAEAADTAPAWLRSIMPKHAGWTLLAGLGLVAVALAALTLHRQRKDADPMDSSPLGSMRVGTEPDEAKPPVDATPATVVPKAASAPVKTPAAPESLGAAPAAPASLPASGSQLFLALHHVDLSIDVLRRHLQRESRPMPAVWLMLLDLCRTHGREKTFAEIALEFHRRFNVCTPMWDGFPPDRDERGLEAYPRLVKEITLIWGTHEVRRLLDRLLYDNRGGDRRGFTLNAYNDLIALRHAADAVLDTIERDLEEEARVRSAFAAARSAFAADAGDDPTARKSALVRDLESQLDGDLRADVAPQSAIEREHPALAGMIAREWGNAAMLARLDEMLARGGDGNQRLSKEASDELELLRRMARRLAAANGIAPLAETVG